MDEELDAEKFLEEYGDQYQPVDPQDHPQQQKEASEFNPDAFLEKHSSEQFDPDSFVKKHEEPQQQIGAVEAGLSHFGRGITLGLQPKVQAYLRSIKNNSDPNVELENLNKWYEQAEQQQYLPSKIGDILGTSATYGAATLAGGPAGLAAAATVDASSRQKPPTKEQLMSSESPVEYGAKRTIEAGTEGVLNPILDKGFRGIGRGVSSAIPDAETAALSGLGATMATRRSLNKKLPIEGEKAADAIAHYVMDEKAGFTPQAILEHVQEKNAKIGHEIGSYVDKTTYLLNSLPKQSRYHFNTNGKQLADEIRQSVVEPARKMMDGKGVAAGEQFAKMAEEMGDMSPQQVFAIRVNLDKMMNDKQAFQAMATGEKAALQGVRQTINENLVDSVTVGEIFDNLADKRAVAMAMNGEISDKQFLTALNQAIEKYNQLKSMPKSSLPDDAAKALAAIERPIQLRKDMRLLKEVEKVAQYGTERAQGNKLFGLRTAGVTSALMGGGLAKGMNPMDVAKMAALAIPIQGAQMYGPMTYAKSANALRKLPNPLTGATGEMIKSGLQSQPAIQLTPEVMEYLRSLSQGGDQ